MMLARLSRPRLAPMAEYEEGGGERAEISKRDEVARESTIAKLSAALKRTDEKPRLLMAAKLARELLPGDSGYGDTLSTLTAQRPSLLGEIALSALQVWDSISAQGADRGQRELTILFTDLVDFSDWSLRA